MIREINEIIAKKDPEVAAAIAAEYDRENNGIELIASENFVSEEVMLAYAELSHQLFFKVMGDYGYFHGKDFSLLIREIFMGTLYFILTDLSTDFRSF